MKKEQIQKFRKLVWGHYHSYGRHDLPWRQTKNPYEILVSEMMLQQTQVARVKDRYQEFLLRFPTLESLHRATLREVLVAWEGLGYNRRAQYLHAFARRVVNEYGGIFPNKYAVLQTLPGIGPYTAGAICNFAFDVPVPILETNIRTVLFHSFFMNQKGVVSDIELLECARTVLDISRPREWHYALMDYGAYLKVQGVRLNAKSAHYTKQSRFKGSNREVRGNLLKALRIQPRATFDILVKFCASPPERVQSQLHALADEGLVRKSGRYWTL